MAEKPTTLLNIEIGNADEGLKSLKEILVFLEKARNSMAKVKQGQSFTSKLAGTPEEVSKAEAEIKHLTNFVEKSVSKAFDEIQKSGKLSLTQVEDFTNELSRFKEVSNDVALTLPEAFVAMQEAITPVGIRLKQLYTQQKGLNEEVRAGILSQQKSAVDIRKAQDELIAQTNAYKQELDILKDLNKEVNDPAVLKEIADRYAEIEKQIQANNTALAEQKELQKQSEAARSGDTLGGKVKNLAGATPQGLEGLSAASSQIAGLSGQAASLAEALKKSNKLAVAWTGLLKMTGIGLSDGSVKLQDFLKTVSTSFQDAASGFERAKSVRENVVGLSEKFGELSKTLANGGSIAAAAAPMVAGLSTAMLALAAPIGVILAGFVAIKAAFEIYNVLMGKSEEQVQKRIETLKKDIQQTRELNELIAEGSLARLQQERQRILDDIEAAQAEVDALRANAVANANITDGLLVTTNQILSIGASLATGQAVIVGGMIDQVGETGAQIKELEGQIKELDGELTNLSQDGLEQAIERTRELNEVIRQGQDVLDDLGDQEQALTDLRIDMLGKTDDYEKDLADAQEEYDQETTALKEQRDEADIKAMQDHIENMQGMENDFQKEVEDTRFEHLKELAKKEKEYIEDVQKKQAAFEKEQKEAVEEFQKEEKESEKDFREQQLEEKIDYEKSIKEMEEQYQIDRIERQKDLAEELFQAELDNDALRFYELKRAGEQAEKEAQDDLKKSKKEEKENFKESQKEAQEDYAKEKAERAKQFQERQAESREQFEEEIVEMAKAHTEEMQELRQQNEDKLREMRFQYEKQRADASRAFQERQKDIADERAQEDLDRLEQLAKKRADIDANFELELEYFARREEILNQHLTSLQAIKDNADKANEALYDLKIDGSEQDDFISKINQEINRYKGIIESGQTLSKEEQADYQRLLELQNELSLAKVSGQTVELTEQDRQLLTEVVDIVAASEANKLEEETRPLLDHDTQEKFDNFLEVMEGGFDDLLQDEIVKKQESVLADNGLQETSSGLQTSEEIANSLKLTEQLVDEQALTIEELRRNVSKMDKEAIARDEENQRRYDEARQTESKLLEEYLSETEGDSLDHYDRQSSATSDAFKKDLQEREDFLDETLNTSEDYYGEQTGLEEDYFSESTSLTEESNKNALKLKMDAANEENKVDQASHTNLLKTNINFNKELNNQTTGSYGSTLQGINQLSQSGLSTVVSTWQSALSSLAASAASASKMSKSGSSSGSGNSGDSIDYKSDKLKKATGKGGSSSAGSGGAAGGVGGSGGGKSFSKSSAYAAAQGMYVDKETLTLTGEGENPELIIPLTKSNGIPESILNTIGKNTEKPDSLPEISVPISGLEKLLASLSQSGSKQYTNSFGNISIGEEMSRAEIERKFEMLMEALVEVVDTATNG